MTRVTFSVITPTLNRAERLARAIASVNDQSVTPLEHIIVDGGSTDGTHQVLAAFPHLKVISEPDRGLYDAINKGIRIAQGDVLVFLNDDDTLLPDALKVATDALVGEPRAEMFVGQIVLETEGEDDILIGATSLQRLNPRALASNTNLFNARFIRRELLERVGPFDARYRIAADTEFLARCDLAGATVAIRPRPVYRYTRHDDSLTFHGGLASIDAITERVAIATDHLRRDLPAHHRRYWMRWVWWWTFYLLVRHRVSGSLREMIRLLRADPFGFGDLVLQIIWHIWTRSARHGAPFRG